MKDSVLATLANSQANKLKIMSKIIYTQDLFCLLFDFKMFFFRLFSGCCVICAYVLYVLYVCRCGCRDQPVLGHSPSLLCLLLRGSH